MLHVALLLTSATASFTVPFGQGPASAGLIREAESSPEAPGSLAVDGDGNVFLLDAVHERVAVFTKDGRLSASIPLPSDTVEDIALTPSGDVAVLDRLVDRTVSLIAPNGAVLARAAVEGAGVDDGGLVTGVFADATGVWIEVLRGTQVRVIDESGKVDDARPTRPGLPMQDRFVRLRKVQDIAAQILFYDAAGAPVGDGSVMFDALLEISGLAVRGDRVYVAGHELVEKYGDDARHTRTIERDRVVVVEMQLVDVNGSKRLVERGRKIVKASPEWVPLKQLVATQDGVAHLYVGSNPKAKAGFGVEVTSW